MNRTVLTLLLLTLTPALAHDLVRDGDVGALLHIEPDDNPIVGKANPTWFEVNQRGGRAVTTTNCDCVLNVYAGSVKPGTKPVATLPVKTSGRRIGASVTFPNDGAYTLVLSGKARAGATFRPFSLAFVVRAGGAGTTPDTDHGGH